VVGIDVIFLLLLMVDVRGRIVDNLVRKYSAMVRDRSIKVITHLPIKAFEAFVSSSFLEGVYEESLIIQHSPKLGAKPLQCLRINIQAP
jgi:hypothetical protein